MLDCNKKVLHMVYGFNGGGVGFVIANYCTRRPLEGISFDIVGENPGVKPLLHDTFKEAGFNVYYVIPKKINLLKNIKQMYRGIRSNKYDAVHIHFEEWSFLYLGIAKFCGVPIRICHAHMAYTPGAKEKVHYKIFRFLLNKWATLRIACSKDAGNHLYGRHPFIVLNNAIDTEKYRYNPEVRAKVRKELNLEGKYVVGVVGRLSYQKNPLFTLEIFKEIYEKDKNAVLMLVGQGELTEHVKVRVCQLGLENAVMFMGLRTDVAELLQAMDVFVLPSRWEGLGIVYVEAQAAGLQTFATDEVVPKEACMSEDLMTFVPKEASPRMWAEAILRKKDCDRIDVIDKIIEKGYDITNEVDNLEKIYRRELGC